MSQEKITGVFAPVVTPFLKNKSINIPAFVEHCQNLIADGCGLAVFGTNSETASATFKERKALVEAVVQAGISPDSIIVGTGACAVDDTVMLTNHALSLGCAGVLVLPPFFFKNVCDDGVFDYYSELIQRVNNPKLRIILYNIPAVSGVQITLSLIERLVADYPEYIVGVKDSSGDWDNLVAMLEQFPQLSIFPASEVFMLKSLEIGAAGCISATNNINAKDIVKAYNDREAARTLGPSITAVRELMQTFPMIPALKYTLSEVTKDPEWRNLRAPLVSMDVAVEEKLKAALSKNYAPLQQVEA